MSVLRLVKPAAIYFGVVFGAGFALGPIRVLWLEPRVGARAAELDVISDGYQDLFRCHDGMIRRASEG